MVGGIVRVLDARTHFRGGRAVERIVKDTMRTIRIAFEQNGCCTIAA